MGFPVIVLAKISTSCQRTMSCASLMWENGILGYGLYSVLVRSLAISMVAPADDVVGIAYM